MTDELERRREECLQLKAMLADRTITTHSIARESYGGMDSLVNEDNELELAYKTQKDLNRSVAESMFVVLFVPVVIVIVVFVIVVVTVMFAVFVIVITLVVMVVVIVVFDVIAVFIDIEDYEWNLVTVVKASTL